MLLQKQLEEKNAFLRKAYEVAYEHYPSSPLSVDINPIELGKTIGFNEITTERIMMELTSERYVQSSIVMGSLIVTQKGLNYLRQLEAIVNKNNFPYD